ncbi:MAG: sporulation protein YqfD [Clostridia bacterium]|nr:sporulation protein YqfD [Clostridia bacterium]
MKRRNRSFPRSVFSEIFGSFEAIIPRPLCEAFLNLCMRYGFVYYGLRFEEDERYVRVTMPESERKRVLTACRMWQIRIRVVSRHGLPQRVRSLKGRWGLLAGAALSLLIYFTAQSVIWRVDVMGNDRLSAEYVRDILAEQGLCVGAKIREINKDSVEQRIMIERDDISWISIGIEGTVARVEIRETLDTDTSEKETKPANLVSRFDAQIVGMEVYSGFLSVKEGDFVRAGELLVSGIYKTEKAPLRFTRASGRILGRVEQSFTVEIPLVQAKKVLKNEKITKKTLIFFGKPIKLFTNYGNLPPTCDIINYLYTFDPFSLGELPIALSVEEYRPYEIRDIEISEDEAIEQAHAKLREIIDGALPDARILKKSVQGEFVDGKYVLKCELTAICDIAKQVELDVID